MKVLKATLVKENIKISFCSVVRCSYVYLFFKNIFPHTINYRLASCLASNANHTYLTTHPKFNPIYTQIRVYLMLISHMAAAGEEEGESPGTDPGDTSPRHRSHHLQGSDLCCSTAREVRGI